MEKIKYILASLTLGLAFSIAQPNSRAISANAGFDETQNFFDNFNNNELNENWNADGATLKSDYSSLKIIPDGQNWSANLIFQKYKISSAASKIQVSFDIQQLKSGGWLGFSCGQPSSNTAWHTGKYGFVFNSDNGGTGYFKNNSETLIENNDEEPSIFSPLAGVNAKRFVSFTFTRKSDNTFLCDYEVKKSKTGDTIGSNSGIKCPNIDGFFSFNAYSCKAELLSFEISDDSDQKGVLKNVWTEDFSKSSVLYSTEGSADAEWVAVSFTTSDISCGLVGKLDLSKNNSSITYNSKFEKSDNNKLDVLYSLNSTFYVDTMSIGAKTGYVVGKNSISGEGSFFGIERRSDGYSLIANDGSPVVVNSLNDEKTIKLSINVLYDGEVELTDGTNCAYGNTDRVNGYFGIATLDVNSGYSGALVDDFEYSINTYIERTTEDVGQSFAGTKEGIDEYGMYYEFFISSHDWHTGTNVRIPRYTSKSALNPHILFSSASNTSAFGPKVKFKDFIARFDVEISTDITKEIGAILGLQVGKPTYEVDYANAKSLGFGFYNGVTTPVATQAEFDDPSEKDKYSKENLFTKEQVLNFVYVVRNNKIEMHYKKGDEPDTELAEIKMVATCENTDGYVAVFGANGISFKLTKFAITNLDYDVVDSEFKESNHFETMRHDFTNNESTAGLELDGASINLNKLKIIEDGCVSTSKSLTGNITRFKVGTIENKLVVKQGNTKLVFNGLNNTITAYNAGTNHVFNLGNDFVMENAIFDIEHAGSKLKINYVSGDKPLARINRCEIVVDEFINPTNETAKIEFIAEGGIVSLKQISIFNLDNHLTIEPRDYDIELDYFEPWVKRKSERKGCSGSLMASCALISILSLIGSVLVLTKKRGARYEK